MLRTSKRSVLVIALLLCIVGSGVVAYGKFWVTSSVSHVDVQYAVVLSSSVSNSNIALDATVTNNGNSVGAGISVDFYYSLNGGAWTYFTTKTTYANGIAQAIYVVTANGAYDFKAVVYVP